MPYRIHLTISGLLILLFLFSCLDRSPPVEETVPPTLTLTPTQTVFYLDKSPLSYGLFETEATSLTIDVSNTVPDQFKDFADISVEDGSGLTTYEVEPGKWRIFHFMPVGKKRITITSGLQTKFRNQIVGVFVNKITFGGAAVRVKQDHNKQIVVYGDSLTVGGNVDHLSAEAWPILLRKHYTVLLEAYGYRTLYDDASTAEARSELASRISSRRPDYVWLAIGANDYAFELWSAQEFGEAYAATLDAIHTSNPGAILFAQSPILRAKEDENSFGNRLDDYRQQISAACLARPVWCIFVDGTNSAFPQPNELDEDGIHLTTESSAKYAEAVRNRIAQ